MELSANLRGGAVRHRGHGLHSGPWTLPSVACILAVVMSGGCIRSACWRSVPSVDDVGVMGEGGEGRHHGHGLHSGLWPLPSVDCILAVVMSGGCIRSACWRSVPSVDDVGVMGEGGEGRHHGHGLHSGPWPLPSVDCILAVVMSGGCIHSACWRNVPSVDHVGVMGEGGEGRHRGRGLHAGE